MLAVALMTNLWVHSAGVLGGGFDRAIEAALPRVVKLYGLGAGLEKGYGSGVLVSEDGKVLTVFSLLIDSHRLRAVTADGTAYGAKVLARDRDRQLALLQLQPRDAASEAEVSYTLGPFPFFDLRIKTAISPGDWLLSAGNAFKLAKDAEPASIAHGVFSARTRLDARRRLKDFPYRGEVLVIDAISNNPGAPGSAVVNLDGHFVGMIGREVISNLTRTHFNFAMPRDILFAFYQEAMEQAESGTGPLTPASDLFRERNGPKRRFDTGIRMSRLGYRKVLPFIERVVSGSPAELAGVQTDDLILSMNGRSIPDAAAYRKHLEGIEADEPIYLVLRRGKTIVAVRMEPEGS